jgi:hypothetical protein
MNMVKKPTKSLIKLVWTKKNGYMYMYKSPDGKKIYSPFKWELMKFKKMYESKERMKKVM